MVRFEHDDDVIIENKKSRFSVNDNVDVLIEILQRLDGRTLGVAACVCRLWCGISRNDSLWAHLCFRASPPTPAENTVVLALGGYKRLYMLCVRPVLLRRKVQRRVEFSGEIDIHRRVWTRREVELALSLFCVDYYERVLIGGKGDSSSAVSLMFLCNELNV